MASVELEDEVGKAFRRWIETEGGRRAFSAQNTPYSAYKAFRAGWAASKTKQNKLPGSFRMRNMF